MDQSYTQYEIRNHLEPTYTGKRHFSKPQRVEKSVNHLHSNNKFENLKDRCIVCPLHKSASTHNSFRYIEGHRRKCEYRNRNSQGLHAVGQSPNCMSAVSCSRATPHLHIAPDVSLSIFSVVKFTTTVFATGDFAVAFRLFFYFRYTFGVFQRPRFSAR